MSRDEKGGGLKRVVAHPFLVAAYPVLFLFAQNLDQGVTLPTLLPPLLFVLAGTGGALGILWLIFRNIRKAGLLTSLLAFLFLSFGPIEDAIGVEGGGGQLFLLGVWASILAGGTFLIVRSGRRLPGVTSGLNVIAATLVALNLAPIATHALGEKAPPPEPAADVPLPSPDTAAPEEKRDIYYLIFDRYANEKTLRKQYGFDNSEFLGWLEDQEFYVAHDSAANHPRTPHSVASSLNLTYLNYLSEVYGEDESDYATVYQLLQNFKVARYLKALGYRYHHIGSWWNATHEDPSADVEHLFRSSVRFSDVFFKSTLLARLWKRFGGDRSDAFGAAQAKRVAYQVDELKGITGDPAPTFTFAHFLVPHPPLIFDRYGNFTPTEEATGTVKERYVEQLIYTNTLIQEMVTHLQAGPDEEDPIIVIQSDEGPNPRRLTIEEDDFNWVTASDAELREKLLILNAYYLPGAGDDALYPTISPVNTFRVIFNEYFGAGLSLEDDRSWVYQDAHHLFRFTDVTDRLR